MELLPLLFPLAILAFGVAGAFMLMLRNLYYICEPNEVLIFAGRSRRLPDGRRVGYRIIKGGSGVRIPLIERVARMDLTNIIIDLRVTNAYSKGGIPLTVEGVANIKIAGEEPIIHNAIERFLGKTREEITLIAKETLEGNLRGVLATLTPEQVNEDKTAFAQALLNEAEDDLNILGLVLDTLKIQNISDDVKYLDSIGRKQRAELLRDARRAEAQARAEAVMRAAENERSKAFARLEAATAMVQAETERRLIDTQTKREAVVAEVEAEIGALLARTQAELAVQRARIEQVRRQLEADVIAPAEADAKRAAAEAKGRAARIVEDGKALVAGLEELLRSWQEAGPAARDIFLMQKLETLLKTMVSTVPQLSIDGVAVIDAEGGSPATKAANFMEQLRQAAGIDLRGVVQALAGAGASGGDVPPLSSPPPAPGGPTTPRSDIT